MLHRSNSSSLRQLCLPHACGSNGLLLIGFGISKTSIKLTPQAATATFGLFNASIALFLTSLCFPASATEAWTPTPGADPIEVLDGVRDDITSNKYNQALAKIQWFYENAVSLEPSLHGVRLVAIEEWVMLGQVYEPAKAALANARTQAVGKVVSGRDDANLWFETFCTINAAYKDDNATVERFLAIERKDRDFAHQLYSLAQPALIRTRQFEICSRHLDPMADYEILLDRYIDLLEVTNTVESPEEKLDLMEFAKGAMLKDASTLIALCIHTNEQAAAQQIASNLRTYLRDGSSQGVIAKAAKGEFPSQ